jgi:hypothetical protein
MSSGTKRRLEDVREDAKAVMEARLRKEYDQMYAKRLRDEVGMRKAAETRADAAEKAAEVAIDKFNARFREVRMWRIRTYRAKSALNSAKENHFVRENDDTWLRTTPVQTEVGGKRLAIKHQLVRESGALQPRKPAREGLVYVIDFCICAFTRKCKNCEFKARKPKKYSF